MTHQVETGRNAEGYWFWRCLSCPDFAAGYGHEVDARHAGGKHGQVIGRV